MRTAVFSDIHANLEALEAVTRSGHDLGVDRWICLGDVVGYGADPAACLTMTLDVAEVVVQGNHDAAVAGTLGAEYFSTHARQAVEWTRQVLSPDQRGLLLGLALRHVEGEAHFVHAEPWAPSAWRYVADATEAATALQACTQRLLFVGHSHTAFVCAGDSAEVVLSGGGGLSLKQGTRYLVNAGSVGQPRDGDPRACFAVYDDRVGRVDLVRVPYDHDAAGDKIRHAGLPEFLALRLAQGC